MAEESKPTGMQILGEKSRTPEFKTARDELVGAVNGWLSQQFTEGGIATEDLVTMTNLGPVNSRVNMVGTSYKEGTSLRGYGVDSPLEFQRVSKDENGDTEVLQITGTDPVASMVREGKFTPGYRQEKVASFSLESISIDGQSNYFKYDFGGDGSVAQRFITDEGVHTGRDLRTAEDIEMASLAFAEVADTATA